MMTNTTFEYHRTVNKQ